MTSIGSGAFEDCSSLSAIYGKFASEDHRCLIVDGELNSFAPVGLTSYSIPSSVTSIGMGAFYGCSGLKSISIPKSVTNIEIIAFYGCTSLEEVISLSTTPPDIDNKNVFSSTPISSATLKVPAESVDLYRAAEGWKDFGTIEAIGIPTNTIYYTSSDGNVVTPYDPNAFGANIVSNTYENGQGVILFDSDVTYIGDFAFSDCYTLTSIEIPSSVTTIGMFAFQGCNGLTTFTVPNSVTSIGQYVFNNCNNLASIEIPSSVTSIGAGAFYYCPGLTAVYIDDLAAWCNIEFDTRYYLNPYNLYLNNNLVTELTIPSSVTSIGPYTFHGCGSLTSVTIPSSVTSIGSSAFEGCSSLASVTIPSSVTSIGSYAFRDCKYLASVAIPNSVTSIYYGAFSGCSSLSAFNGKFSSDDHRCLIVDGVLNSFAPAGQTAYTIPSSVTSIGLEAFRNCGSLMSVTIPNSVTAIHGLAFRGCSNLSAFYGEYASDDNRCLIVDGVLISFAPAGLTSYTIPSSVTSIESVAFEGYSNLISITIPTSVTNISSSAFSNCSGLTSVTIPSSVTSINPYTFTGCRGLKSVTIPNSVRYIGDGAFNQCISLESVTIPKSVNEIGLIAFQNCSSLKEVVSLRTTPPTTIGDYVFNGVPTTTCTLKVPAGSIDAYSTADVWKEFGTIEAIGIPTNTIYYTSSDGSVVTPKTSGTFGANIVSNTYENGQGIIEFDGDVTEIGRSVFATKKLTSIEIPNSVTSIRYAAFFNSTNLASVNIPNSVTEIEDAAFHGCTSLTTVVIPNSVTTINSGVFSGCSNLASVTIPNSITTIESNAFYGCMGLKSAIIPNSVTSIAQQAFQYSGLTSVAIPSTVLSIGIGAFGDCQNLTEITVEQDNPSYYSEDGILFNKDRTVLLTCPGGYRQNSYEIPTGVQEIETLSFWGCKNISSVTIPDDVERIKSGAFDNCQLLTSIYIPKTVTSIGIRPFENCSNFESIIVDTENTRYSSADGILFNKAKTSIESVPEGIKISRYEIPTTVTNISMRAFCGCANINEIIMPNSVVAIGEDAFSACKGLTSVTLSENLTTISDYAFGECENLTNIKLGSNISIIEGSAFSGCSSLEEIISLNPTPPTIGDYVFNGVPTTTCVLKVPAGSVAAYRAAEGWGDFVNIEELPEENNDYKLIIEDQEARKGGVKIVPISIENKEIISAFQFDITLPENVTIEEVTMADRAKNIDVNYGLKDNHYTIVAMSMSGKTISGNEGVVMNIKLKIDESVEEAVYIANVTNIIFTEDGKDVNVPATSFHITVEDYLLGDVNGNGFITVTDAVAVVNHVIGKPQAVFIEKAADVNNSGTITVTDAVAIVNIVIGRTRAMRVKRNYNIVNDDNVSLARRADGFSLSLNNDNDYLAFQCEIELPEGMTLEDVVLNAERSSGHTVYYNQISDNRYVVASLSLNGGTYNGDSGELLRLQTTGNGEISVENLKFVAGNGEEVEMTLTRSTGLDFIETEENNGEVYDLYGRKRDINSLNRGIYINNKKRILVK